MALTTKVEQNLTKLKVTVRLSRNIDAVDGKCSGKQVFLKLSVW